MAFFKSNTTGVSVNQRFDALQTCVRRCASTKLATISHSARRFHKKAPHRKNSAISASVVKTPALDRPNEKNLPTPKMRSECPTMQGLSDSTSVTFFFTPGVSQRDSTAASPWHAADVDQTAVHAWRAENTASDPAAVPILLAKDSPERVKRRRERAGRTSTRAR
jgi:hypothetical protein